MYMYIHACVYMSQCVYAHNRQLLLSIIIILSSSYLKEQCYSSRPSPLTTQSEQHCDMYMYLSLCQHFSFSRFWYHSRTFVAGLFALDIQCVHNTVYTCMCTCICIYRTSDERALWSLQTNSETINSTPKSILYMYCNLHICVLCSYMYRYSRVFPRVLPHEHPWNSRHYFTEADKAFTG